MKDKRDFFTKSLFCILIKKSSYIPTA